MLLNWNEKFGFGEGLFKEAPVIVKATSLRQSDRRLADPKNAEATQIGCNRMTTHGATGTRSLAPR